MGNLFTEMLSYARLMKKEGFSKSAKNEGMMIIWSYVLDEVYTE